MQKAIFIGLILLMTLTGCARIVTDKTIVDENGNVITPSTKKIEFTFSLAGDPTHDQDWSKYKYYLVLTTSKNCNVVNTSYPNQTYFFAPGESISNQKVIDAYYGIGSGKDLQNVYDDYFVSWNAFITYDSTRIFTQYNGPFTSSANHSVYATKGFQIPAPSNPPNANQIRFVLDYPPYDNFYFYFLAVDNRSDQDKQLCSYVRNVPITPDNPNISETTSQIFGLSGVDSGLDIKSYQVRTYEF